MKLFIKYLFNFTQLGMRNYHLRKNTKWCPTLNLDKLWTLVSEQTRLKYKDAKPDGKVPVIDLVRAVSILFPFINIILNAKKLLHQDFPKFFNL